MELLYYYNKHGFLRNLFYLTSFLIMIDAHEPNGQKIQMNDKNESHEKFTHPALQFGLFVIFLNVLLTSKKLRAFLREN